MDKLKNLEERIKKLEEEVKKRDRNQIQLPLDVTSINVVGKALQVSGYSL